MNSGKLMCITALTLFILLAIPVQLAAQGNQDHNHKHHHYKLIDMGTFGGPASSVNETFPFVNGHGDINGRGSVVGSAATSTATTKTSNPLVCGGLGGIPFVSHAFEWHKRVVTDLGALPGADNCSGPGMISGNGEVVGTSENGEIDPLTGGHAFLLIPCDEHHPAVGGCDYSLVDASFAVPQTSPAVRNTSSRKLPPSLLRRMSRYHIPGSAFGPRN